MSKYSDEFEMNHPTVEDVKKRTKEILDAGEKLASEEIHDAKSLERLKKQIRRS